MADGAQRVGRHLCGGEVVEAFIAAGQELVGDVMSCACPKSQSRTAEELGVIRVREDDEDVLRGVPIVHFDK